MRVRIFFLARLCSLFLLWACAVPVKRIVIDYPNELVSKAPKETFEISALALDQTAWMAEVASQEENPYFLFVFFKLKEYPLQLVMYRYDGRTLQETLQRYQLGCLVENRFEKAHFVDKMENKSLYFLNHTGEYQQIKFTNSCEGRYEYHNADGTIEDLYLFKVSISPSWLCKMFFSMWIFWPVKNGFVVSTMGNMASH